MLRIAFLGMLAVVVVGRLGDEHQGVLSAEDGASNALPVGTAPDTVKAVINRCPAGNVPAVHYELKKDWAIGTLQAAGQHYFKWISDAPPSAFKATGFNPNNRDEISLLAGQPPTILKDSANKDVCRLWFAFPASGPNDVTVPKALKILYPAPKYVYVFSIPGSSIGYYYSTNGRLNDGAEVAFPYSISAASISVYDTATKVTTPLANA